MALQGPKSSGAFENWAPGHEPASARGNGFEATRNEKKQEISTNAAPQVSYKLSQKLFLNSSLKRFISVISKLQLWAVP